MQFDLVRRLSDTAMAVFLPRLYIGQKMQATIEILKITNKSGIAKSGKPYSINEAHCILRAEDGTVSAVGVLVLPKSVEESAKVGKFSATFALEAASYGDDQGRIVARIVGLQAVDAAGAVKPLQAAPVASPAVVGRVQ